MPGIWGNSANIILSCSSIRLILPCFSNYLYRSSSLFEFLSILMGLDVIELPNILSSFLFWAELSRTISVENGRFSGG
jgi:hypothetical protein